MSPRKLEAPEIDRLFSRVAALASEYVAQLDGARIAPHTTAKSLNAALQEPWPETGLGSGALEKLSAIIENTRRTNGRFYGYILAPGDPVGAAADLLASAMNQNLTAWRSGPSAVTVERMVVSWLAEAVGCAGFAGSLCGGGSPANLMGLAMAREAKAPANQAGAQPCTVYASREVHMAVPKAVALLGIGRDNLRLVDVDTEFRLDVVALRSAIEADIAAGKTPVAVVASAGTVNTGALDPLEGIAAIAREFGLWFHVDGAYGALASIAIPEKLKGLHLADSLALDPHKWLYQPVDCGCLLYRDREVARKTFSHTGDYAKSLSQDPDEGFSFFEESMELSRRFRALKLWLSLRYHGKAAYREAINRDLAHARRLAELVTKQPQMEVLAPVVLSAVCFRYKGTDGLNAAILKRVQERGRVYISNATIRGKFALRACFVNFLTTDADVEAIVAEVLAAAEEVQSGTGASS